MPIALPTSLIQFIDRLTVQQLELASCFSGNCPFVALNALVHSLFLVVTFQPEASENSEFISHHVQCGPLTVNLRLLL